jgi:hypothetical protein
MDDFEPGVSEHSPFNSLALAREAPFKIAMHDSLGDDKACGTVNEVEQKVGTVVIC